MSLDWSPATPGSSNLLGNCFKPDSAATLCRVCLCCVEPACWCLGGTGGVFEPDHVCCIAIGCGVGATVVQLWAAPAEAALNSQVEHSRVWVGSSHATLPRMFSEQNFRAVGQLWGLCRPGEKKGSGAVHTAFNRSTSSRWDLLPGSDEGVLQRRCCPDSSRENGLFTGVWEGDSSSGTGSWSSPAEASAALDGCLQRTSVLGSASVHSHALVLFQSPIFGPLFLGGNPSWSSLQAEKHMWEMWCDDSPGISSPSWCSRCSHCCLV